MGWYHFDPVAARYAGRVRAATLWGAVAVTTFPCASICPVSAAEMASGKKRQTARVGESKTIKLSVSMLESLGDGGGAVPPLAGDILWLQIEFRNVGQKVVYVPVRGADWTGDDTSEQLYQFTVLDSAGKPVPMTRYGRMLLQKKSPRPKDSGPPSPPRMSLPPAVPLQNGRSIRTVYPLGLIYDLSVPGRYTVTVRSRLTGVGELSAKASFVLELPSRLTAGDPRLPNDSSDAAAVTVQRTQPAPEN